MIRRAKISEIPDILRVTRACAAFMTDKNIFQWNENYPSKATFETDIERNELYVLVINEQIIGSIVVSSCIDAEYIPVSWLTATDRNLYIHRLAVHPSYQGRGYAQQLMDFAELYAKENDYVSVRLDTFSKNERNIKFYETRGYKRLSDIFFPNQSKHPFHCYELVLK